MIQWTADLAVNVLDIDNQHKELFARINRFFDAFDRQAGASEIRGLFAYLEDYISMHFRTEEAYMDKHLVPAVSPGTNMPSSGNTSGIWRTWRRYTYPDYERHKDQHRAFARDFREFAKDLDDEAAARLIVTEFRNWMTNWWLLHVSNTDKGLGKSLQEALLVLRNPR